MKRKFQQIKKNQGNKNNENEEIVSSSDDEAFLSNKKSGDYQDHENSHFSGRTLSSNTESDYEDNEYDEDDSFFENDDERKVSLAKKFLKKIDALNDSDIKKSLDKLEDKLSQRDIADTFNIVGGSKFYKGHKLSPTCVTLDKDGRIAYTGGKDCAIIKWDLETGKKIIFPGSRKDFECGGHFEQVKTICYHKETNLICSGGEDKVIRIWDHRVKKCVEKFHGHTNTITGIVSEPNSEIDQIISVSFDKSLKVWSLKSRSHMNTYYGHTNKITSCDMILKDRPFTGAEDNTSRLWKLSADSHLIFYPSHNFNIDGSKNIESPIDSVSCLNNVNYISGQQDGTLHIWSQFKKKPLFTNNSLHQGGIYSIKSIPFTDLFFTGSDDQEIKAWKWSSQNNNISLINSIKISGFVNDISITDKLIVAAIGQEHRLGRWNSIKDSKNGLLVVPISYDN
ncbi:Rrp9p U3-55K-family snoRNP-associated with several WD40 repeats [Cryptosporidium sp. chipmunk genotype I]|uniref:Rrp9p U3-55K-family snoRNP-associated with several WD40 repeats n=1 Tax=Cryptosporidium sp. chipmunk genotype I TaxID=1280935 RepID=UPI00351A06C7|nr:Rrp9p U3-55K-family snoRNP-associated with several WD40 repeats [Cryptosporidium sp. chipmunk genotype I]